MNVFCIFFIVIYQITIQKFKTFADAQEGNMMHSTFEKDED